MQLVVQELSTTPQQHSSEVFVWEWVLAAHIHTGLVALLTAWKGAGGIPKANAAL